jgi:hypothetical protein
VRTEFDALPGIVIALPWTEYVATSVTANRSVADPLGSYFGHRLLASRDAGVPGLPADIGRRAAIAAAVRQARSQAAKGGTVQLGAALRGLGVAGVLALGDDDTLLLSHDPDLTVRAAGDDVTLFRVSSFG